MREFSTSSSRYMPDNLKGALTRAQSATSKKHIANISISTPVLLRKRPNLDPGRKLVSKAKTLSARAKRRRDEKDISVSPEILPTQKCRSTATSNRDVDRNTVLVMYEDDVVLSETGSDSKTWMQVISDPEDEEISLKRTVEGKHTHTNSTDDTETTQPDTDSVKGAEDERKKRKKHRSKSRKEKRRSKSRSREGKKSKDKDRERSKKKNKSKHRRDKKHQRRDKKKRRGSGSSSSVTSSSVRESECSSDREVTEESSTDSHKLETVVEVIEDVLPRRNQGAEPSHPATGRYFIEVCVFFLVFKLN